MANDTVRGEDVLARAVNYLMEGGERREAMLLAECRLGLETAGDDLLGLIHEDRVVMRLRATRSTYDVLRVTETHRARHVTRIEAALTIAAEAFGIAVGSVQVSLIAERAPDDWRDRIRTALSVRGGEERTSEDPFRWNGFALKSPGELAIAEELDRRGVLFFPNALCRLSAGDDRSNREVDFLVCHEGRWGVLEVDGVRSHRGRAVVDSKRDRLFTLHGVRAVERFPHKECVEAPAKKVDEFLAVLGARH